jgi:hypothetical protein
MLTVSSNDPDFPIIEIPVLFEVTENISITQCIDLVAGWNLVSARVVPENTDMLNVVQPLIDENILFKVLDEAGGSIFHLPVPPPNGQWTNSIGDLEATEGYYIKVVDDGMLCIEGSAVTTPLVIALTTGWNIISYPCEFPQDALEVVQPLIDEGLLYKVIDESGGTIFHLPVPVPNGQWTNSIGDFTNGEGYYLKVSENTSLTINCPSGTDCLPTIKPMKAETGYFTPVFDNNPYMPMHIILQANEFLQDGDEIGIFDGEICVGASVYAGDIEIPIIISTAMDDASTEVIDGFEQGNPVMIKSYDQLNGTISELEVIFIEGSNTFDALGSFVGEIQSLTTGISNLSVVDSKPEVAPNPFSYKTNLLIFLSQKSSVNLQVQDFYGNIIKKLPKQILENGEHIIGVDLRDIDQGVYFLNVEVQNENNTYKYSSKIIKL